MIENILNIQEFEEGLITELSKKVDMPKDIKEKTNSFKSLSVVELWKSLVEYNEKLTDLINEMGTVSLPDPCESEYPDEYVKDKNIRDISSGISYILYVMTEIEKEIYRKI